MHAVPLLVAGPLKALQVEVTSRCNASCTFCPRTILRDRWVSKDMSLELFARIADGISRELGLVYLQGWGEPLMNPRLEAMIKLVKERSDADVGLTTNGTLLEERAIGPLLDAGLDVIGISFAGAVAETHNALRKGCDFDRVVENAAALVKQNRLRGDSVRVIASFMMTKQNTREIPGFVALCNEIGIAEITLDNLTYLPSKAPYASRAFSCHGEKLDRSLVSFVDQGKKLAKEAGIRVFAYKLSCNELATCPEAPTSTMFIGVEGEVSPCVFTNIPTVDHKIPRCFADKQSDADRLVFGNAGIEDLDGIWNVEEYSRFRGVFERRTRVAEDAAELLSPLLDPVTDLTLPEQCQTCYRVFGV